VVVLDPSSKVVATVRLIEGTRPWMFDEVFRDLLPGDGTLDRGGMEASRLAVAPAARGVRLSGGRRVADLLFKSAYLLCRQRGVRNLYMVTSDAVARRFTTAGLPCFPLATGTRMPDGVLAMPLVLDWSRLREDAPLRAWFEDRGRPADGAPARLDAERARRSQPPPAPPPAAVAQGWREQRVRASG
jgi:N-acyl-L-homoserine lactone synthetase